VCGGELVSYVCVRDFKRLLRDQLFLIALILPVQHASVSARCTKDGRGDAGCALEQRIDHDLGSVDHSDHRLEVCTDSLDHSVRVSSTKEIDNTDHHDLRPI
ncbi:unnamed protein product, partial [Pylaiella littoralis]